MKETRQNHADIDNNKTEFVQKDIPTPGAPKKNNKPFIIAGIFFLVCLVALTIMFLLDGNGHKYSFETDDDIDLFFADAQEELDQFEGIVTISRISDGEKVSVSEVDTKNKIAYLKGSFIEELYITENMTYEFDGDSWFYSESYQGFDLKDYGLDFSGNFLNAQEYTYTGQVDCPESNGTCYELTDEISDITVYFNTETLFISYINNSYLGGYLYTYSPGEEIAIPNEAIEDSIPFDNLTPVQDSLESEKGAENETNVEFEPDDEYFDLNQTEVYELPEAKDEVE